MMLHKYKYHEMNRVTMEIFVFSNIFKNFCIFWIIIYSKDYVVIMTLNLCLYIFNAYFDDIAILLLKNQFIRELQWLKY